MALVAGIDSSTQSCKVVIRDAETGALVRSGHAPHPDGSTVAPEHWWRGMQGAIHGAGGLADVAAISVAGQQHGLVCLDERGGTVCDALLWNDIRSASAAEDLIRELGGGTGAGAQRWVDAVGVVPVASITVAKRRWLAEPDRAARTMAVCLPHDRLTWRLRGTANIADLVTDRSDASGTGYWSAATGEYRIDLLELAFGASPQVPRVAAPHELVGVAGGLGFASLGLAPGCGDNAGAALGLGAEPGDVVVSIGTSGVVSAVAMAPSHDPSGAVAGFASADGRFLPLVCTLNAARALTATATLLGIDLDELSARALAAPSGAEGVVMVPYLEGERTPNLPHASGSIHGLRLHTAAPENFARAAVEGMLCGLADGLDALVEHGIAAERVVLVGGELGQRRFAGSRPPCSGDRFRSLLPVITSPTGPRARHPGHCSAVPSRPPGRPRRQSDTRPVRTRPFATGTPRFETGSSVAQSAISTDTIGPSAAQGSGTSDQRGTLTLFEG